MGQPYESHGKAYITLPHPLVTWYNIYERKYPMMPINKRNIGMSILLSLLTLGIYSFYWKYLLVKNVRAIKNDNSSCTGEMLCLIFVPFYSIYWWVTRGETVRVELSRHGLSTYSNEVLFGVLAFFWLEIIAMIIMQNDFNTLPTDSTHSVQQSPKKGLIRVSISVAAAVGVVLILNANLLFPWQWVQRENKRAALEYVNSTYPGARFISAYYNSTKFLNTTSDRFDFEQNGIKFSVRVSSGDVSSDDYRYSYVEYRLYKAYIEPFTAPRKITAEFSYSWDNFSDYFNNNLDADFSQFEGSVEIEINDSKCTDPRFAGWLYEFYRYCKRSFPISDYSISIICSDNVLKFSDDSQFESEDDFYNSFEKSKYHWH